MAIIIGSLKPIIVSRASETHCGPAKVDFGWPDWPAREKVKHDPCIGVQMYGCTSIMVYKCMGVQVYRCTVYKRMGVHVYRCTSIWVYWDVQVLLRCTNV